MRGYSVPNHIGSVSVHRLYCGYVWSYCISFCCQSLIAKEHITSAQEHGVILPWPITCFSYCYVPKFPFSGSFYCTVSFIHWAQLSYTKAKRMPNSILIPKNDSLLVHNPLILQYRTCVLLWGLFCLSLSEVCV